MERPLTEWEWDVLAALTSVDSEFAMAVETARPCLVVTGTPCECGCASFHVRDSREGGRPEGMAHVANGRSRPGCGRWADDQVGLFLLAGSNCRLSVDIDNEPGRLPDPSTIEVSTPPSTAYHAPHRSTEA
jgi:hypothetical protein